MLSSDAIGRCGEFDACAVLRCHRTMWRVRCMWWTVEEDCMHERITIRRTQSPGERKLYVSSSPNMCSSKSQKREFGEEDLHVTYLRSAACPSAHRARSPCAFPDPRTRRRPISRPTARRRYVVSITVVEWCPQQERNQLSLSLTSPDPTTHSPLTSPLVLLA